MSSERSTAWGVTVPKSYEEVLETKEALEEDYRERHEAHRKLRMFWHGGYWKNADVDKGGIESVFRDLTANASTVGPDLKLVHNTIFEVCLKYQTFLSNLPMIRVPADDPSSTKRRAQATKKERFLMGMWSAGKMNVQLSHGGWFLPLMGDFFLGTFPDLAQKIVRPVIRSPEYAYPVPSFDGFGMDATIFCWKAKESAVRREYPNWEPKRRTKKRFTFGRSASSDPETEILEYTDGKEWCRFIDGTKVQGVEHGYGFNLYEQVKFINVPGEVFGHGAVEQAVNLVEMGNLYLSLMMHSAIDNVFPVMVLVDPSKAPEELEKGPGAVIPVMAGGDVKYLTPPVNAMGTQAGWLNEIDQIVKQATSMPDVNFGQFRASIVTGKAINELQGAGTGSLVEMVQGVSLGSALSAWNEKAVYIGQTAFREDTMRLFVTERSTVADINPRTREITIKGKELVGSGRNEVVFQPHLGMHEKIVMGLQMAGAGLVSKQWQREQVGIPDSQAMQEEIISEAIEDAVVGALVGSMQQDPSAQNATQIEEQAFSYIQGGAPHPLLAAGGNVPQGALPMGYGTAPPASTGGPPMPVPAPDAPRDTPTPGRTITLQDAQMAFMQVRGVTGKVYLVGEIVVRGATDDDLEVAVTEAGDRQVLADQLTMFAGRLVFHVVDEQPDEDFIEVTPGAPQQSSPALAEMQAAMVGPPPGQIAA